MFAQGIVTKPNAWKTVFRLAEAVKVVVFEGNAKLVFLHLSGSTFASQQNPPPLSLFKRRSQMC